MILSYMSDLRILCSRFRNVHNVLKNLEDEATQSGQALSYDPIALRNTVFRRWMVARCVLARLETATHSIVDLIEQRSLQAIETARRTTQEEKQQAEEEWERQRDEMRGELATQGAENHR